MGCNQIDGRAVRDLALEQLATFEQRHLASVLRRLAQWKGLDSRRHADVVDDLRQELALDCLEHAREIVAMSDRERSKRWFRLVHGAFYRLRTRDLRITTQLEEMDGLPNPSPSNQLGPTDDEFQTVAEAVVHLRNGKLNAEATAGRLGMRRRSFRSMWRDCTTRLGFGPEFVAFWRRRLLEALLAYASDLLRARGAANLYAEDRLPRADPEASRRRIARIQDALSSHPVPPDVKRVFTLLARRPDDANAVTEAAVRLEPDEPAAHLWRFESNVARDDLVGASAELRKFDTSRARVPTILARARLLEARGRLGQAQRMLRRAIAREADPRLALSLSRLAHRQRIPLRYAVSASALRRKTPQRERPSLHA